MSEYLKNIGEYHLAEQMDGAEMPCMAIEERDKYTAKIVLLM